MNWSSRRSVVALVIAGAGFGLACNETPVGLPTATTIQLSAATLTMEIGDFISLTAQVLDAGGNVLTGQAIAWSSDNDAVVTVTSGAGGSLTARDAGTANITASHGAISATAAVTVVAATNRFTRIDAIDIAVPTLEVDIVASTAPGAPGPGLVVKFSAISGTGAEVCHTSGNGGPVPTIRFDATVLGANTRILTGWPTTCQIYIRPGTQAAGTWLYVESGVAVDSMWVDVTDYGFHASFTTIPAALDLIAGSVQPYIVTFLDKNNQAVASQLVQFDVTQGTAPATITTAASGDAAINWTLPQSTTTPVSPPRIRYVAEMPAGVRLTAFSNATVLPGPIVSAMVHDVTMSMGTANIIDVTSGVAVVKPLGAPLAPRFLVQGYDQYGNEAPTSVLYSMNNPDLPILTIMGNPGGCPASCAGFGSPARFQLRPVALGTVNATLSVGAATFVVGVNSTVGPDIVLSRWTGARYVIERGQPQYASALTDIHVYNNVSSVATFSPTFSPNGNFVAFTTNYLGVANVAVVAADGTDSSATIAAVSLLTAADGASWWWGFPVFEGAADANVLYLSNKDPVKTLAGDNNWDLYRVIRATGTITKITATAAADTRRFFGLSRSPDGTKVLVVSVNQDLAATPQRHSQVHEINIATGVITTLTTNSTDGRFFNRATYSSTGLIYVESNFSSGLLELNGTTLTPIGTGVNAQLWTSFEPGNPALFAAREGSTIRFRDLSDPSTAIVLDGVGNTNGRTHVSLEFSWSPR